MTESTNLAAE